MNSQQSASPTVARGASGKTGGRLAEISTPSIQHNRPNRQAPTSTMLAHALRYALAGWRVLPLVVNGKAPLTAHGVKDASTDPETIGAWWQRWPAANIGLALGDDVVCFDVDPRNGGTIDALARLGLDHGATVTQRTAGGGWHVIYQKPHGWPLAGKVANVLGVDVLSGDKYIVAAPSVIDGRRYTWERDPLDVDPARIPLDLAERLTKRSPAARTDAQNGPTAAHSGPRGNVPPLHVVEHALAHLDPWSFGYDTWLACLMALHSAYPGPDGLALAEAWADGAPGEVAGKWATFDAAGGVGIGTLIFHARAAGWQPPAADEADLPAAWRITPEDWRACPVCAALYSVEMDDGSVSTHHKWCRRKTCNVYRKVKARDALRPVFGWPGVQTETVPAADWRRWRKQANLLHGDNWRAMPPFPNGDRLALYSVDSDGLNLDDVLNVAVTAILENEAARRARRDALAFLNTLPENEALDPVNLARMKEALDLLASTPKGGNVSTPRRKRTDPAPEVQPATPRPKPVGTIMVSSFRQRPAMLAVLNRLNIPWERRSYGGWRTEPLTPGQLVQLKTALAFGVPGARVLSGALEAGSYAELSTPWPEDLPHTEREAALYALRERVNLEQSLPLRR